MSSNLHKYKNTFLIIGIFFVLVLIMLTAYSWYLLFEFSLSKQALQNANKNFERTVAESQAELSDVDELNSPESAYSFEEKKAALDSLNEVEGSEEDEQDDASAGASGGGSSSVTNETPASVTDNNSDTTSSEVNAELETEIFIEEEYDDVPDETGYSESQKRNSLNDLDVVYSEEEQTEEEGEVVEESSGSNGGSDEFEEQATDNTEAQMQSEEGFYNDFYENDPYLQENPNG